VNDTQAAADHDGDHQAAQLGHGTGVLPFDFFTYDQLMTELHLARVNEQSLRRELRDWMGRHDKAVQRAHTWKFRALHLGSVLAAMSKPPKGRTDVQKEAVRWALSPRRPEED